MTGSPLAGVHPLVRPTTTADGLACVSYPRPRWWVPIEKAVVTLAIPRAERSGYIRSWLLPRRDYLDAAGRRGTADQIRFIWRKLRAR